ncbi:MAG: TIGR03915 family putative DNA repair protein [Flavobacterium sp.]|nr:TIGR03915 family putative DNA repair protein [Flavobacterium sp.]
MSSIYLFDGSFEGLLTAVFDAYELKNNVVRIVTDSHYEPSLLDDVHHVVTDENKATRVLNGLRKKLSIDWQNRIFKAYLSELPEAFQHIFDFLRYVFDNTTKVETNYGHPSVIAISKLDKSVNRERHRMKAFIRFQETADGSFYAAVDPDYNVLPLIVSFFKNRYADQKWIIYDIKRKYGLYYDLHEVISVTFDFVEEVKDGNPQTAVLDEKESLYSVLWSDYFKSTNIPARKNMKLHLQHVPKRYWKYLTEKQ